MPTVYLADDHAIARAGTKALLEGFEVVGEASNARDATRGILETRPDVAVIDVHMDTKRAGADVVRSVKETEPEIVCVALSVSQSKRDVAALFAAGVDGYLTKQTLGSYNHLHFGSQPQAARCFVDNCLAYQRQKEKRI